MALLTADQIREHADTDLGDDALDRIIAAEEAEIVREHGPSGTTNATGHYTPPSAATTIVLDRKASSIVSIVERTGTDADTIDAAAYRLEGDGRTVRRLPDSIDGNSYWAERVDVTYTPVADDDRRTMALVDLVKLRLAFTGNLRVQAGDAAVTAADYARERARILRSAGTPVVAV